MTDTAKEVARKSRGGEVVPIPLASTAKTYKKGWFINRNSSGYGKLGADAASESFAGIAEKEVEVPSGGSNGDESMDVIQTGLHLTNFYSTLTPASAGKAGYVKNNYQAALLADVTHAVFMCIIVAYVSAHEAWVDIEPATRRYAKIADAVS